MAKVLVISPPTYLRAGLTEHLHQCGFLVIRAEKASHGLNMLRANHPELVIIDHKLPDLDGLSLCVLIRQDVSFHRSAIVMLADAEHEEDMARALDAGADDYILWGASLSLVASRLRAVMRRAGDQRPGAPHQGRIFDNGRLRVDLVGRSVDVGQRELRLSYQEFELLAEFVRHPGIPLSREFLIARVWGNQELISSRTVDVHVRWLRQKIEDDPANPRQIVTIRGVGYRFNPG